MTITDSRRNHFFDDGRPPRVPIGTVFIWQGRMWRRGVGILYRARPCVRGLVYESYRRRENRRQRRSERSHNLIIVTQE